MYTAFMGTLLSTNKIQQSEQLGNAFHLTLSWAKLRKSFCGIQGYPREKIAQLML